MLHVIFFFFWMVSDTFSSLNSVLCWQFHHNLIKYANDSAQSEMERREQGKWENEPDVHNANSLHPYAVCRCQIRGPSRSKSFRGSLCRINISIRSARAPKYRETNRVWTWSGRHALDEGWNRWSCLASLVICSPIFLAKKLVNRVLGTEFCI